MSWKTRRGRRFFFDVNQRSQSLSKFAPGSMKPAPHRADGNLEQGADLLVAATVEVLEHHHRPLLGPESGEGRFDDGLAFDPFQGEGRIGLGRLSAGSSPGMPLPG